MLINQEWDYFLKINELKKEKWFRVLLDFINNIYEQSESIICPAKNNIFKMFKELSPIEINVFLLFQEPYSTLRNNKCVSNGIGLASSYLTPSLKHFFQSIDENIKDNNIDITLNSLIKQNVFLINKYLTINKKPLSHSPYSFIYKGNLIRWDLFTKNLVKRLNEEFNGIAYIFFGTEAKVYSKYINKYKNYLLITSSPSPKGYKYGILKSNFHKKVNNYLKKQNKTEIQWINYMN